MCRSGIILVRILGLKDLRLVQNKYAVILKKDYYHSLISCGRFKTISRKTFEEYKVFVLKIKKFTLPYIDFLQSLWKSEIYVDIIPWCHINVSIILFTEDFV